MRTNKWLYGWHKLCITSNWHQQQRQGAIIHVSLPLSLSLAGEQAIVFSTSHFIRWRYLGDQARQFLPITFIFSQDRCKFIHLEATPTHTHYHDFTSQTCVVCHSPHHHSVGCYQCEPTISCLIVFLIIFFFVLPHLLFPTRTQVKF